MDAIKYLDFPNYQWCFSWSRQLLGEIQ